MRALEKHLPQFKKTAQFSNQPQMPHPGGFIAPASTQTPLGLNMSQLSTASSLKDETSPGKSPATASSSWHSPSQMPGTSPITTNPATFMQPQMRDPGPYAMTPTHPHSQAGYPSQNLVMGAPRGNAHRRVMSDMSGAGSPDDHPEKRQRMYQPPHGAYPQ